MSRERAKLTRRKFLAASAAGLAGAGLGAFPSGAILASEPTPEAVPGELAVRTLGKTGIKTPVMSQGVGACQDPSMVVASYEAGLRHFDTAANYGFGANEQMLGDVLKRLGVRDKVSIATKIYTPAQRRPGSTAKQIKDYLAKAVEASLRRLRSDYVDIVYVHDVQDAATVSDPALLEGMQALKDAGKTKALGMSTHANMATVLSETANAGIWDVALTSINFTMADDPDFMKTVAAVGKAGIGIVGMKVMAGAGRWPNPETRRTYSTDVTMSAAIKWVLNNEHISTIIPGFTTREQLDLDLSAARDLAYTDEERRFLSDNAIKLGIGFCRQCRKCLATCPHDVDIPNLMRTHMYAAQYGNFLMARTAFDDIPREHGLGQCLACETCRAECANSVDIDRRIGELKLIYG